MRKKSTHIAQLDRLQAMARLVLLLEDLLKALDIILLELTEALTQQTKEALVRALLGTRIQDHLTQLNALVLFDIHFKELVGTFLIVERRLDC